MLHDKDRIFTNLYGFQPWTIDAAIKRGDATMLGIVTCACCFPKARPPFSVWFQRDDCQFAKLLKVPKAMTAFAPFFCA